MQEETCSRKAEKVVSLTQEEEEALSRQAEIPVFRLMDLTDPTGGGSCVAIKLGTKLFLATAAHVVHARHEYEIILPDRVGSLKYPFVDIHKDEDSDVAALEIKSSMVNVFRDEFICQDQLLCHFDQQHAWPAIVIGYPSELLGHGRVTSAIPGINIVVRPTRAFTLHTSTIPKEKWPLRARPLYDIFLNYEQYKAEKTAMKCLHSGNAGVTAQVFHRKPPAMPGISGGAIWLKRVTQNPVWKPSLQLIGLQVSWVSEIPRIRGTLIRRWLDLVGRHYPDLREIISGIHENKI